MASLSTPDFARKSSMWARFWEADASLRPLVVAPVVDEERLAGRRIDYWDKRYQYAVTSRFDDALRQVDLMLEVTDYLGEAMPDFSPDHGPDQFAAFCGTDLEYSTESPGTNWAHPVVEAWSSFLPLRLDEASKTWQGITAYSRHLAQHAAGRYAVSMADLHSNIDALAALRGPEKLCMDFCECPDLVAEAMQQVRALYPLVYRKLHEAGAMASTGTAGWAPFWCEGRYATIQADFICMVSPDISRQFIIPALEEEADFLDHCVYHLDGPGTLPHLDDILSIRKIDVIQWVPGAGQPPQFEWMDLLRRCQAAGKGLQIFDAWDMDLLKRFHRELDPRGVVYCLNGWKRDAVMQAIEYLECTPGGGRA